MAKKEKGPVTREEFEALKREVREHAKASGYADVVKSNCKHKGGDEDANQDEQK